VVLLLAPVLAFGASGSYLQQRVVMENAELVFAFTNGSR
jgi:hypothetical protein